ncbi:MAG: dimethyladenosine transferase [Bacteroidales bacterium]|nr:dimethyladenosine transferase [Bacteroidales bacterium]
MSFAKKIYWIIPAAQRRKLENLFKYSIRTNLTNRIINYYEQDKSKLTPEIQEVTTYLKTNWIRMIPYEFMKEYQEVQVEVLLDENCKLPYVIHNKHKMFFKRSMNKAQVTKNYRSLLSELDPRSPHKYLSKTFFANEGDVIIDVGAAEGIFALNEIEKAKKIYLIESNKEWVEALYQTFEPWKDKIEIIEKLASDSTTQDTIALDDIYNESLTVNFIKMDVEGYERKVVAGCKKILSNEKNIKLDICTYHKQGDGDYFVQLLSEIGFKIEFSYGYMLSMDFADTEEPYLRRGVIRAQKI